MSKLSSLTCVVILVILPARAFLQAPARGSLSETVATVEYDGGSEEITRQDVMLQLALQPKVWMLPPSEDDFHTALEECVEQAMIRLSMRADNFVPRAVPQSDVKGAVNKILARFGADVLFDRRLKLAGYSSIRDEEFEDEIEKRLRTDEYVRLKFLPYIYVTDAEVTIYYREVFVPKFRASTPKLVMPTLEEQKEPIRKILIDRKLVMHVRQFIARERPQAKVVFHDVIAAGKSTK